MDDQFVGYNAWAAEALDIAVNADLVYEETSEGGDRGVYISDEIQAQTTILSIPAASLLNVHTMAQSVLRDLVSLPLREDDCLAWFLIYERFVNPQSKWKRHLDVMPQAFHNILYFTEDEINMLQGSNVYYVALQLKQQVASDFGELQRTLLPTTLRLLHADHSADALVRVFTIENYKWALSVIWSRFVSIAIHATAADDDDDTTAAVKSMVPVFDMFNHDPFAQMSHGFDPTTNSFVLRSHQHWPAGSQVYMNYGALPNHKLLTLYGFVLPSNPFDVVELWAPMHEDVPSYDRKLALLTAHGLAEHATSTPFDLYSDSVNDELLASLRIQRLSDTELSQFESGTPHFAFEPIHDDNEKDTLTALIYALQQMLAAFPTAVEDDEAELAARQEGDDEQETGDEASHHVMALHLRVSDKRILHAQIDMLQELLLPVLARLNLASQD
ncbi:hypothetical protein DYB38_003449 [Aphanomyces astaci]|uniref:Rubisco LSMT substrate-binding domain-containing protein n=2 Tax=Aphanomyces astaci TaxID=112090 RepID=A0A396ZP85_APHAT|nr:hypothetical protein DYB36_001622 [Aphanomyces astaci]RHY76901.1 hypothetical protein DYB38_003449 [Aphanomyces astaci]